MDSEEEEEEPSDMINQDLTHEERQEEFINLMKQRFVDRNDPDFGKKTQISFKTSLSSVHPEYPPFFKQY